MQEKPKKKNWILILGIPTIAILLGVRYMVTGEANQILKTNPEDEQKMMADVARMQKKAINPGPKAPAPQADVKPSEPVKTEAPVPTVLENETAKSVPEKEVIVTTPPSTPVIESPLPAPKAAPKSNQKISGVMMYVPVFWGGLRVSLFNGAQDLVHGLALEGNTAHRLWISSGEPASTVWTCPPGSSLDEDNSQCEAVGVIDKFQIPSFKNWFTGQTKVFSVAFSRAYFTYDARSMEAQSIHRKITSEERRPAALQKTNHH